jgi:hypothetical protein
MISDSVRKIEGGEPRYNSGRARPGPAQSRINPMSVAAPERFRFLIAHHVLERTEVSWRVLRKYYTIASFHIFKRKILWISICRPLSIPFHWYSYYMHYSCSQFGSIWEEFHEIDTSGIL